MRWRGVRAHRLARNRPRQASGFFTLTSWRWMAHTFFLVGCFLSGLVSGGFWVFGGWYGLDSPGKVPKKGAWVVKEWCLVLESLGWIRSLGLFWPFTWPACPF